MKKKYAKPNLNKESMELQSAVIRTCSSVDDSWWPIETGMEDDDGNALIVFVPELDCTISDYDYMIQYGGNNGNCYYAATDDGKHFS